MDQQTQIWIFGLIIGALAYLVISDTVKSRKLAVIEVIVNDLRTRFDIFVKTETDAFKNIVQENTNALKQISNKKP